MKIQGDELQINVATNPRLNEIQEYVRNNTNILKLNFYDGDHVSPAKDYSGIMQTIVELLSEPSIKELGISFVQAKQLLQLSNDLITNKTLEYLGVSRTQIGIEGAKYIGNIISFNTTLTCINLFWDGIGDKGVMHVAKGLINNNSLQTLLLGRNAIGDDGAYYIAEMLKYNHSLIELSLCKNFIGSNGMTSLANSLEQNTTLKRLDLYDNQSIYKLSSDEGGFNTYVATAFIETLANNTTLTNLDFESDDIDDEYKALISYSLNNNRLATLSIDNEPLANDSQGDIPEVNLTGTDADIGS